jgi:DNA-binding transcriptional ArsR family regulator
LGFEVFLRQLRARVAAAYVDLDQIGFMSPAPPPSPPPLPRPPPPSPPALGDSHRARFVLALLGGEELAAGQLAARAGTSSSLTSAHLARLLESGLVTVETRGRRRLYKIASAQVAESIEALLTIAPHRAANSLRDATRGKSLQRARTCYDHLAGQLGVAPADTLERDGVLAPSAGGWDLTSEGRPRLEVLGLDTALHQSRRPFLRPCLDWTERRPHVAGALGRALADRLLDLGWVRRSTQSRAIVITAHGEQQLLAEFAIKI